MTRVEILAVATGLWTIALCCLVQLVISIESHIQAKESRRRNVAHQEKVAEIMDTVAEGQSRAIAAIERRAEVDDEGDEWKHGGGDEPGRSR